MPAQIACQVGPNMVAQNASSVPRTRITPLVPSTLIRTKPGQERAENAADHSPRIDLPIAVPVRLNFFSRSTASLATTGLTVPMVTAGRKKTSVTTNKIRNGQLSEIWIVPASDSRERVGLLKERVAAHRRRACRRGTQAECRAE